MTGRLSIILQSALLQQDGLNKTSPEGHQEIGLGDFQPNQLFLKLLTWKVAGRSQVCSTAIVSVWVFLVHFLLKSSPVPLESP